jgi:small subunit ribosomal protein S1
MSMQEDFESLLEASFNNLVTEFTPGQKVKGIVEKITHNSIFLNINSTSEGIINREELLDEDGEIKIEVGDELEAFYLNTDDGSINLSVKMSGHINSSQLDEAYKSQIPVEGKVIEERNGGFGVKIANETAFCPYSQISLDYVDNPTIFLGQTLSFIITELSHRNIVVSRKPILTKERETLKASLKDTLQEGDIVDGTVKKFMKFGVFVDLGGMDGLIPNSELAWSRNTKAEDLMNIGDTVSVKVKSINWDENKISLSFRSATTPWDSIAERYPKGKRCQATITRLEQYGAFAELEQGIEGLIHISKFSTGKRISHPREVVSVGDIIEVVVDSVDLETERIALARSVMDEQGVHQKAESFKETIELEEGLEVTGKVDSIMDYGMFIKLDSQKSGLLHISKLEKKNIYSSQDMRKSYQQGDSITVIIENIKDGKISLDLLSDNDSTTTSNEQTDIGSLGGLFDGLTL